MDTTVNIVVTPLGFPGNADNILRFDPIPYLNDKGFHVFPSGVLSGTGYVASLDGSAIKLVFDTPPQGRSTVTVVLVIGGV